jgi:Lrp/AsnC family leucine-responsive transcriptional regulator
MAVELDDLDRKLVSLLLRDGRTPASQLADKIGLSRPAVAERIEKLERNGVIRGTTVVLEPAALGLQITAFVSARSVSHMSAATWKAFDALMRKSDEVLEVHTVAGDDCYLIKLRTDSIATLNTLVAKLTAPPLLLTTRTTIVMQTHCEKVGGITLGEPS